MVWKKWSISLAAFEFFQTNFYIRRWYQSIKRDTDDLKRTWLIISRKIKFNLSYTKMFNLSVDDQVQVLHQKIILQFLPKKKIHSNKYIPKQTCDKYRQRKERCECVAKKYCIRCASRIEKKCSDCDGLSLKCTSNGK